MKTIFLGMPCFGPIDPAAAWSFFPQTTQKHRIVPQTNGCSLLAMNCNVLWANALNQRAKHELTHFAMLHADIGMEPWWLDKLIDEMDRVGADVLSVVVPLKSDAGITSTAKLWDSDKVDRMTLDEVTKVGPTFDALAISACVKALLVNTGCFVCDFTKPWVEEIHFKITDFIRKNDDGTFEARNFPEDWNFSVQCHKLGLKVFATTIVEATHYGRKGWSNKFQDSQELASVA